MRDIIKCAGSKEPREHLLRRLAIPRQEWFWNCAPAEEVRRLYVVHRQEIIGWMPVLGIECIDKAVTVRWGDGSLHKIEGGIRTITLSPFNAIDPPVWHMGFRGFRYFDFEKYVAELCDAPRLEVLGV